MDKEKLAKAKTALGLGVLLAPEPKKEVLAGLLIKFIKLEKEEDWEGLRNLVSSIERHIDKNKKQKIVFKEGKFYERKEE